MLTPVLDASGLRLIPYSAVHDAQTVAWLNDPEIRHAFGLTRELTPASHREWIANNSTALIWAIVEDKDGNQMHCGNILLHPVMARRSAYFQIYLGSAARGKGVGSRALTSVLNYGFDGVGLHRIWLHTLPGNVAAEALYQKLGFTREGVEREALPRGDGFVDQACWSLLEHEWRAGAAARRP